MGSALAHSCEHMRHHLSSTFRAYTTRGAVEPVHLHEYIILSLYTHDSVGQGDYLFIVKLGLALQAHNLLIVRHVRQGLNH